MKRVSIQQGISIIALLLIIVHLFWPQVAIDGITLGLIAIAIVPWLSPVFKSLQLPGGVKIEYQDFEKTEKQIKEAGLLPKKQKTSQKSIDFVPSPNDDPTIALAWLRIEIEKRLKELAKENKVSANRGLRQNMITLYENDIINSEERNALADVTGILNDAIHGVKVEPSAAEWAIEVGPLLLKGLDNKLKKK